MFLIMLCLLVLFSSWSILFFIQKKQNFDKTEADKVTEKKSIRHKKNSVPKKIRMKATVKMTAPGLE